MRVLVIENTREGQERAQIAVEAAGHHATFANTPTDAFFALDDKPRNEEETNRIVTAYNPHGLDGRDRFIRCMLSAHVDGVITDLYFPPDEYGFELWRDGYRQNLVATGLLIVAHVISKGKQVVICTNRQHHSSAATASFNSYLNSMRWMFESEVDEQPFGFVDGKDWHYAVRVLERRVRAGE